MALSLLHALVGLAARSQRMDAARELARALGTEDLVVFIRDPEVGSHLPALGFPQTLPEGRAWRAFVRQCAAAEGRMLQSELRYPDLETKRSANGLLCPGDLVLVLLGERPDQAALQELLPLMPLLAASCTAEHNAQIGEGHASVARAGARQLEALAATLANAHASLQEAFREQHAMAATRAAEQEFLRVTLQSIGDAVLTTDGTGRVASLNPMAETLTGWSGGEAAGRPLEEVFHIINEYTRQSVENPARRVLNEGVVVGLANHTLLLARDGTERPIDDSAAPIRDGSGSVLGVVLVFRDVSERRQAEAVAREQEQRFRTLVEQVDDYAIFTADTQGRATSWNQGVRRVLGFEEADFLGQDVTSSTFTPEDVESGVPQREMEEAAATGRAGNDRWMTRKDGSRFFATGITTALRGHDGSLLGFMRIMRDQTGSKHLEDELRQYAADLSEADRRKNEFLAMLAHELRNPLAPLRNAAHALRMDSEDGAAVRATAMMMERQIGQMVRLVDDLLDVNRITRGTIELRREPVDLAAAVVRAVEDARTLGPCRDRGIDVSPGPSLHVSADPARLAQIVGNLVHNACKFSDAGGRVSVSIAREAEQAVLRVRDDGIGMAAEQLPRVFEMFAQVDSSLERSSGGLGIGLALVKALVQMHGGSVEAHSAGLGQGSELVVRLPIIAETSAPPEPVAQVPLTVAGRRILVVDDNRDSAESLAMLLQMTGHETRTAHDGLEAVSVAASYRPHVVLLDIGLPGLNGYEAARRIRAQPEGARMLLVALTGWGQDEDRRRSSDAGFDRHLVKPVEPDALMRLLAEADAAE